ncbi:MAG: hypothetical protein ACLRFI_03550 [Alphaproteobacteria bacterium]
MHEQQITDLKTTEIVSEIYTIAPTQFEYIAKSLGDTVADRMGMRTLAPKIRQIAMVALRHALTNARHMGEQK